MVWIDQYNSEACAEAHRATAAELLADLPDLRAVVIAVGSGGTLLGHARHFEAVGQSVDIWGVDEVGSLALPDAPPPAPRHLQGLGSGLPREAPVFHRYVDHAVHVTAADAVVAASRLARQEGILAGGSGGAVVHALQQVVAPAYEEGACVAAILPDHGVRYSDTFHDDTWRAERGLPGWDT